MNATRSLYAAPNRFTSQRIAALDLPVADAMRAPGEAIGLLALEQAMDELATRLNIDPIELRIKNEPKEDPEKNVPFSTRALVPCLQEGARRFGWDKRQARPQSVRDGRWLVGLGVAAAIRGNILRPAEARVTMQSARNAVVEMDMTDIGTGSYTIFAQIAAEGLGLPVENVEVRLGHSSYPITPGSGGSFGASSCGAALYDACRKLKARLDAGEGAQGLTATGQVKPGDEYKKYSQFAYGAHFAEVAVEETTGEVRLRRMLGVFAAGRILNAKTARSQLIGGMLWGVSSALFEDAVVDPRYRRLRDPGPRQLPRARPCRHRRGRRRDAGRVRRATPTCWVQKASANSASAAPAPRSPTPSTTPAAPACATTRSRSTRSCQS